MIESPAGAGNDPAPASQDLDRVYDSHARWRMRPSTSELDVLYVGFVLGHGGDALQMVDLAAEVSRRGLRTRILVPELPTTLVAEARAQDEGLDIVRTPWIRADAHRSRQHLPSLLRAFRENRAGLYHLHTGDVCLPRLVLLALGLLDVRPVVVTTQSPYATLTPGDARARHWAHAARKHLDRIVCPSNHSRQLQLAYGVDPDKVTTIHNSVDIGRFTKGDPQKVRSALGLAADKRIALFSSRLDPQKRPADAVRAFARVAGEFPDLHLAMAGSGREEPSLRQLVDSLQIRDRVHFPGFQSNVPDWLAAASMWLFPTESENFSLALLEALAAGCPIVSTLCPGNDEVLVADRNALICPIGDVEAIAGAMRKILTRPDLAERLSREARQTADEYSVATMADRYARCYNECLGHPSGG